MSNRDYILLVVALPGLRWGAIITAEYFAARAEADGVEDWSDLFWPRVLRLLSSKQAQHVERQIADRLKEKET